MFRGLYKALMNLIRRKVSKPNYIDMSFHNFNHFLRMVYSLNEQHGMVSVPIPIEQYDSFSPRLAQPDKVAVNLNWWQIPDDAQLWRDLFLATKPISLHSAALFSS